MVLITKLPKGQKTQTTKYKTAADAYSHVSGGIVMPVNDTLNELIGAELPAFYVRVVEGCTNHYVHPDTIGVPRGAVYHEQPSTGAGSMFVAFDDNKIYNIKDGVAVLVRDVAVDGFTIARLDGINVTRYGYFVIGDKLMSAQVYKYDPNFSVSLTNIVDYSGTEAGTVKVTAVAHGLQTGASVTITDTTSYNGTFDITVIDVDNFYFTTAYVADETAGEVAAQFIQLVAAPSLIEGADILAQMESRLLAFSADTTANSGQFSKLDPTFADPNFTPGTLQDDGGDLAGGMVRVRCARYFKGLSFVFERQRLTVHRVGDPFSNLSELIRDNNSLEEGYSVDGFGTSSPYGACVGAGQIFYCDEAAGVFSYSASGTGKNLKVGGKELSDVIHETITSYDLSSVALGYHPTEDVLMVACASIKGNVNDTVFYYSFQTKAWSKDPTKFVSQFIWHAEENQMYGVSSLGPKIVSVFDGTNFDEFGAPITMRVRSRYFSAGQRSKNKEYVDSSIIVGVPTLVEEFDFSLYINSQTTPQVEKTIDVKNFVSPGLDIMASGPWGESMFGAGSGDESGDLNFIQYWDYSSIDPHRRIAMEISVSPGLPFAVFVPEITCEVAEETSDSFR